MQLGERIKNNWQERAEFLYQGYGDKNQGFSFSLIQKSNLMKVPYLPRGLRMVHLDVLIISMMKRLWTTASWGWISIALTYELMIIFFLWKRYLKYLLIIWSCRYYYYYGLVSVCSTIFTYRLGCQHCSNWQFLETSVVKVLF